MISNKKIEKKSAVYPSSIIYPNNKYVSKKI